MKFVRWLLGRLILAIDFLTRPKPVARDAEEQSALDQKTAKLALYQFEACPFCVKVRRQIRRQGLRIELRDAKDNPLFSKELATQGGKHKVPCLRIEGDDNTFTWLYESNDINAFLQKEFGQSEAA